MKETRTEAVQADGKTPLDIVGEVHETFTRSKVTFVFNGLVASNLDVEILGGAPFQKTNGIMTDFVNENIIVNQPGQKCSFPFTKIQTATIGAVTRLLKVKKQTVINPYESLMMTIDEDLNRNQTFIVEPRTENEFDWPSTQEVTAVGNKIKVANNLPHPIYLPKDAVVQLRQTIGVDALQVEETLPEKKPIKPELDYKCDTHKVAIDAGNQMSPEAVDLAKSLIKKHKTVFGNDIPGYNGFKGKFEASFEFSSHERPIIGKTQVPVYNKKHSDIFQQKCDLEHARGRIQSLSELGEQPALINNAFLVLKQSAAEDGKTLQNCDVTDVRLVCSFNELGKYIKKMPAKITTEAEIWARTARFNLMGETDLTDAFSQMNMRKDKRKYLCFLTPHKGIMCYSSGPQGLLGMSEYDRSCLRRPYHGQYLFENT